MNSKQIPLLILFAILLGCSNEKKSSQSDKKEINVPTKTVKGRATDLPSINKALEDKIVEFMKEHDSISNPFNRPTLYSVLFYQKNKDSLVSIIAGVAFNLSYKAPSSGTLPNYKGVSFINGKMVGFFFDSKTNSSFGLIKNTDLLNQNLGKKYSLKLLYENHDRTMWTFTPPTWTYKIEHKNHLVLKEKSSGA